LAHTTHSTTIYSHENGWFGHPKERGWKVVLQKDPCGRCITNKVWANPMDFNMFTVEHVDWYVGLQTPQSIEKIVQPTIVMGGCPIKATSVMAKDLDHTR